MLYSLLPTMGALYFAVTGFFVLWRDKTTTANFTFFLLCITTFFWQFTWALLFQTDDSELASKLIKLGFLFILFLPTTLYHFLARMARRKSESKFIKLSYGFSAVLALLLLTGDYVISGYHQYFFGYYPKAGVLHPLHVLQTCLVVSRGLYLAFTAIRRSTALHKKQLQYCAASLLIYFFAAVDYLCNYGVEFYPPGIVFIIIALGIMAYSITRFQLLDISVVLTEKLARFFALVVVATLYLFGYSFCKYFFPLEKDWLALSLNLAFIAFATTSFSAIQKQIQTIPGRIFPKRYSLSAAIKTLNDELDKILSINKLFAFVDHFLSVVMRISLLEVYSCNDKDTKTLVKWDSESETFIHTRTIDIKRLESIKNHTSPVIYNYHDSACRRVFKSHRAAAAILCYEQEQLIGAFFISLPARYREYTYNDNRLLDRLARQIAPVLHRALTHNKVVDYLQESQKNASLVNLVNEYNHEIKGPLSILHSYATHPSLADEHSLRELIIKQVERTSGILDTMLSIAQGKHQRSTLPVDLNETIEQSLKLFPITFAEVTLKLSTASTEIIGDKNDLHILFINLLKNTVEAMHKANDDFEDDFDAMLIIKTEKLNHSIRVELSDTGIGIPEDELERIWDTGYSKRDTGSGGLGLSVVKRIVEEHNGNIRVFNNPTAGVTFQLNFPLQDNSAKPALVEQAINR